MASQKRGADSAGYGGTPVQRLLEPNGGFFTRIGALPSEGVEIISALEQAEKRYPTDYRFPYELSKLSIKGIVSHHEAFEPLIRAAQKAIDNGQADEMLSSLMADKDGDFVKLSHGHHEWEALEQALLNKDKGLLNVSAH